MITDDDKNILGRNDLVLLRERRLREFLTDWFKLNPDCSIITIEEKIILFHNSLEDIRKRTSIVLPLNSHELSTDMLINHVIQQLFEKITDIPWEKKICNFSYTEVFLDFSDFASLYPSTLVSNPNMTFVMTPDRYYTRPFPKRSKS